MAGEGVDFLTISRQSSFFEFAEDITMQNWNKITVSGLTSKSGEAYVITIGAPNKHDGTYCCRLVIPTIIDRDIYGENALSTVISALRIVEAQIYEPSVAIVLATTLTEDDYPDLEISIAATGLE